MYMKEIIVFDIRSRTDVNRMLPMIDFGSSDVVKR